MLSGYLLLDKNEKLKNFLLTRISRLLIPLVAWSVFYVMWNAYYEKTVPLTTRSMYQILFNPAYYHLWFLYALIGNYLYIPILKVFMDNSTRQLQYYFIALWFLAVSLSDLVEEAMGLTSAIDLKMIGYVGYLVIGSLIGNMKITQKHIVYSGLVILVCLSITILGTYCASAWRGTYISYWTLAKSDC
jgi:surface polysaccharide O-acyltransferase-like enzyme